jgi:hypothetical protein
MGAKVTITRRFTGGTLEGLTHEDVVRFPSIHAARRWAKGVLGLEVPRPIGGSPYRIEAAVASEEGR